jgi:hypothetical protein
MHGTAPAVALLLAVAAVGAVRSGAPILESSSANALTPD